MKPGEYLTLEHLRKGGGIEKENVVDKERLSRSTVTFKVDCHNGDTSEVTVMDKTIIVHKTIVGGYHLKTGGHYTQSTKRNMNKIIPDRFTVYQEDFKWYVHDRLEDETIPFEEGIAVSYRRGIYNYEEEEE